MLYLKAIRDGIPDILKNAGVNAIVVQVPQQDFKRALVRKLDEEIAEYFESYDTCELADIVEVLEALYSYGVLSSKQLVKLMHQVYELAHIDGSDLGDLATIRRDKAALRGKFEKRYILVTAD